MERISSYASYWLSALLAFFGAQTPDKIALYIGTGCAVFTALVNAWYRRKMYLCLKASGVDKGALRGICR